MHMRSTRGVVPLHKCCACKCSISTACDRNPTIEPGIYKINMTTSIQDILPQNFGYVILTFIYSYVMLMYLGINVGRGRKKYGVKYPQMYSDKENVFNCIQRAHQNTLEVYPSWLILQLIAGFAFPLSASVLGVIWVTSRFSYAHGYYTGDPEKRMRGAYGYIGLFGVLILSVTAALQLLRVV
ncbi:glutathione S-transferase 3, mitochondrial-like isoform X2 [Engystomops pustulosus]|uniref:glutathione S-transferase 3, mitochondrial-like isoform X2 n=1 Tax=Engystomops pustulosus TaxID=76066 RepID=UPI003AFA0D34